MGNIVTVLDNNSFFVELFYILGLEFFEFLDIEIHY